MRTLNLLLALLCVIGAMAISQTAKKSHVANGIYAVLCEAPTAVEAGKGQESAAVLIYDGRYTDSSQVQNPSFVAVDATFFVPLIIEGTPDAQKDGRGHTLLGVSLKRKYAGVLERFTQVHIGGRVAIVLDGEVITMHKIKSIIKGGKFQLTRCYDNACEALQSKLLEK
jgi:hypothetical protein